MAFFFCFSKFGFLAIPAILGNLFAHSRDLSNGDVLRRKSTPCSEVHFQSTRGRGNWDPNGRPQTTEVQAVLEFPPDQPAFIAD